MRKLIFTLFAAAVMTGCARTDMVTYVDAEFTNSSFESIVTDARGVSITYKPILEAAICKQLLTNGVSCSPRDAVVPPTREFTNDEIQSLYLAGGYDGILVVGLRNEKQKQSIGGSVTTFNGFSAVSTPIVHSSRLIEYETRLFDAESAKVAALSRANTSASGTANTTLYVFAESYAKEIVKQLKEKGLIETKEVKEKGRTGMYQYEP